MSHTSDNTFAAWQDGHLTDTEALRALCYQLGEVESEIVPLDAEKAVLRDQISRVLAQFDNPQTITGFGKLELTAPSITANYDKRKLDRLVLALISQGQSELAADITACRSETARAGGLRIVREKEVMPGSSPA